MTDEIRDQLLEINYVQTLYQSAEHIKQMADQELKAKPLDFKAKALRGKAEETCKELTQIVRLLQEDVLKYFQKKYSVDLKLYQPDPKQN